MKVHISTSGSVAHGEVFSPDNNDLLANTESFPETQCIKRLIDQCWSRNLKEITLAVDSRLASVAAGVMLGDWGNFSFHAPLDGSGLIELRLGMPAVLHYWGKKDEVKSKPGRGVSSNRAPLPDVPEPKESDK